MKAIDHDIKATKPVKIIKIPELILGCLLRNMIFSS